MNQVTLHNKLKITLLKRFALSPQVISRSTAGIFNVLEFLDNSLLKPTNLSSTLRNVTRDRSLKRTRRETEDEFDLDHPPAPEFSVSVFGELKKEGDQDNLTLFEDASSDDKDVSELFLDPANFHSVTEFSAF